MGRGIVGVLMLALAGAGAAHGVKHRTFYANDYGAMGDGTTLDTVAIQKAIDAAALVRGVATFRPGTYLTGSLFLKSAMVLDVPEGVTLLGSEKLEDYPEIQTRIAGIEMTWPAALVNVIGQDRVTIRGKGTIDGDGPVWWKSYWDLRANYEPKGLRWASDYDAKRPRLILIQNSTNFLMYGGITLKRSGFWTVHILYSNGVRLNGIIIRNNEGGRGPSTDGIDIDSSRNVMVERADIDVNDDALCLKAGRDSDGLRVNRPTEHVTLRNSIIRHGAAAVTIGSETSGGFRDIEAYRITALSGVPSGVLFKSAQTRGGLAENIRIHDLDLRGVAVPIHITMNWNPSYSYAAIPAGLTDVPGYYKVLAAPVPEAQGLPHFRDVRIWKIKATGAKTAFNVSAYRQAPLENFGFSRINIDAQTAGTIANAKNWHFSRMKVRASDGSTVKMTEQMVADPKDVPYGEPEKTGTRE